MDIKFFNMMKPSNLKPKIILLLSAIFALFMVQNSKAQVVVTNSNSNGNYPTLGAAFTVINGTAQTGLNITIAITGNTTEAASAVLNAGAWTTITISPSGGAARTISGSIAGALISFNGADNVTINGLNTGGNSLTIDNPSTGANSQAVLYTNDAEGNTLTNCTLKGSGTGTISSATTLGSVVAFGAVTTNGNRNNTLSNNLITASGSNLPTCGISSYGSATATGGIYNSGITINNNEIYDVFAPAASNWAIHLSNRSNACTITNNKIYQTATRTATGASLCYGIYVNCSTGTTTGGFTVNNNKVGGSNNTATGTAYTIAGSFASRFFPIRVNHATTGATSDIQGNLVQNISLTSTSGVTVPGIFTGIYLESGSANVGSTTGNTVGASAYPITISGSTATSVWGMYIQETNSGLSVSNNTVSYITISSATATVGHALYGIQVAGVGSTTTNLNTVTNLTSGANGTTTATTAAMGVWGINSSSSGAPTVTNNTINNLVLYSSGTSSTGLLVRGIEASGGGATTITGNTINALTNAARPTGTGTRAGIIGIFNNNNTSTGNVSGNTIHTLECTNSTAGAYSVIGMRLSSTGASTCAKNVVHSLNVTNGSTLAILYGIFIGSGTYNVNNNMVRLGIDAAGASIGGDYLIKGIDANAGATTIAFNSVYVGGTPSAATNITYGIDAGSNVVVTNFRNNIAVNVRSTSGATNKHVALYHSGVLTSTFLTNNLVLSASAANGGAIARNSSLGYYNALSTWQATGYNATGLSSNPQFINATGTAALVDLHINTGSGTEIESAGVTVSGITTDIDNDTRLASPDIGADEGTFISVDLTAPTIGTVTIADLTGTTAPGTVSVTITDANAGVNTTAGTKPRLYYKKCTEANVIAGNTSASNGWKYVEASNSSSPFTFTINYSLLTGGGVTAGTIINYFVVSQDNATTPNVSISNNLTFGTAPSSVALTTANLPAAPPAYIHQITTGTFTLGTSGTFSSLTGNCGCFRVVNASAAVLTGNVTLNVTSDVTEDNSYQLTTSGTGGVTTVVVQPSAATNYLISGTVADPSIASSSTLYQMIGISGTGKFKVDGRFGGSGRYLTFRNTSASTANTAPVIKASGSGGITLDLNYATFEFNNQYGGSGSQFAAHAINVFTSGGTNNITITNSVIRDPQGDNLGSPSGGIYVNSLNSTTTITNNEVINVYYTPIQVYVAATTNITGNSIYLTSTLTFPIGYYAISVGYNGGGPYTVNNNYIGGSAANCGGSRMVISTSAVDFRGIYVGGAATSALQAQGNTIQNITLSGTGSNTFYGIHVPSGNGGLNTGTGNTIGHATNSALGITNAGSGITCGIYSQSAIYACTISNNTIANIEATGTANTVQLFGIRHVASGSTTQAINTNTITELSTNSSKVLNALNRGTNGSPVTGDANAAIIGIEFLQTSATGTNTINGNTLSFFRALNTGTAATAVIGISADGSNNGATANNIAKNKIFGFENKSTASASPFGSISGVRTVERKWSVSNNFISLDNLTNTNNLWVYGILEGATVTTASTTSPNYWYNSIYIGGTNASAGAANSAAFSIIGSIASGNTCTVRSNLLANFRTGGTGNGHYAMEVLSLPALTTGYSGDYNDFYAPVASKLCRRAGTDHTLATWKAINVTVHDPNGVSVRPYYTDPATCDLHLNISQNCALSNLGGNALALVPDDIDGTTRVAPTDIGADEFTSTPPTAALTGSSTICSGLSANLTLTLTGQSPWDVNYNAGVTPVSLTGITSTSTTITVNPTTTTTYTLTNLVSGSCTVTTFATPSATVTIDNACPLTWDGSTSTVWNDATNWTPEIIPTATNNISIPNVANDPDLSTGAVGACKDVDISSGATLTIGTGKTIDVKGNWNGTNNVVSGAGTLIFSSTSAPQTIAGGLTANTLQINNTGGGVTVATGTNRVRINTALELKSGQLTTNGNLITVSTAVNTAYVDDFSPTFTGTLSGNVAVQRYINFGVNGFRYIGAPVNNGGGSLNLSNVAGFVISGVPGQIIPLGTCTPTFNPANVAQNSPYGTFMYWQENGPYGTPACRQRGWWFQTTGAMTIGRGYGAKLSPGTTVTYTGAANTGAISWGPCTNSNVFGITFDGWNLVSNPYPSSIKISNGDADPNNNMPAGFNLNLNYYETNGLFTGTYQPLNTAQVNPPSIALGQGIWAKVQAQGGTATWALTNAHRVTGAATYFSTNEDQKLTVNIVGNGFGDRTFVYFNPAAESGYDIYDGDKFDSRAEQPTLYTKVGESQVAVNTLPSLQETVVVPMGLKPGTSGNFSFTFEDVATFPQSAIIYLEDKKLGTMTNIRTISSYDFSSSTNDNIDRFALHFQPGLQAEVSDQDCDNAGSIELTQPAPTVWSTYEVKGNDNNVYAQGTNLTGSVTINNLPAQEYVVTVTHPSGYSAQEYVTVNGSSPVNATINASATNVMIDQQVTLTANATNATEYVWNFGDGNTQQGSASVVHAYDAAGTYNVTVTASSNTCTDVATKTIVVGNTTGINTAESGLTVNGVGTNVVIEFNNWGNGKANIMMFDMLGKEINSLTGVSTINGRHEIRVTDIKPGYYLIRVISGDKIYTRKLFLTADE